MTEVVIGKIEKIFQPREFSGKLSPGKIVLDADEGQAVITVWQVYEDSVRTDKMPSLWNNLDFEWSINKTVAISCKFDKTYTNPTTGAVQQQYSKMSAIKFIGDQAPKQAETKPVARTAPSGTEDTVSSPQPSNQMSLDERISWNSAWNNAVNAYSSHPPMHWATSTRTYLQLVDALANDFYPYIRRGREVEPVEMEPEEEGVVELTYLHDGDADAVVGEI